MSRLSLRARLVLGVLVVAGAGLVVADIATYASLKSSLMDRVDRGLDDDHRSAERFILSGNYEESFGPGPGVFVQVRSSSGQILFTSEVPHFPGAAAPAPPKLPATIDVSESPVGGGPDRAGYFTVPATTGDERYRVRASLEPGSNVMLVIAASLADVDATLHRLFVIELFVTLGVLAAIGALGLWIVRLGLRPLAAIGRTADEITAGVLSRRFVLS
jgi:two-component system OmpR family sensor kinase